MPTPKPKPKDSVRNALDVVERAIGAPLTPNPNVRFAVPLTPPKDPNAVALGRKGGLKGGKARAESMTAEERSESAKKAAKARWKIWKKKTK